MRMLRGGRSELVRVRGLCARVLRQLRAEGACARFGSGGARGGVWCARMLRG